MRRRKLRCLEILQDFANFHLGHRHEEAWPHKSGVQGILQFGTDSLGSGLAKWRALATHIVGQVTPERLIMDLVVGDTAPQYHPGAKRPQKEQFRHFVVEWTSVLRWNIFRPAELFLLFLDRY